MHSFYVAGQVVHPADGFAARQVFYKEETMKLSARNQFQGTVTHITLRTAMAEVTVKGGNIEFVAAITEGSVKNMGPMCDDR